MNSINRMVTSPIDVPRSNRNHNLTVMTSLPAGKVVPLAAIPLLREDSVRSGTARISFEMMETAEILMNPVHVNVHAHLVPWLAMERFEGSMDAFNKSYAGKPSLEGGTVIPFFEHQPMENHGVNQVYKYLGLHARPGTLVNTMYLEAYNAIWNMRAKNRSPKITERSRLRQDLAPAFWPGSRFAHIVPTFDQAIVDGEVALNVLNSKLAVRGIGSVGGGTQAFSGIRESGDQSGTKSWPSAFKARADGGTADIIVQARNGYADVWAELQENGITVSLSNIEMAKKTQAYARLRQQFSEHSDEFIIDMLMSGLSIPDQSLKQPMLLAQRSTVFGMSKRYATDSGNLDESAVNGATFVDLSINIPRIATGGVIIITAEIVPEQIYERQKDAFFHIGTPGHLPDWLRDDLDPEKVVAVPNDYVDIDHDTPNATFGYAPLNHEWNYTGVRVGGKFLRPAVDASFDEDRQRLWANETQNPALAQDFYIATTIHQKPFLDTEADPFEAVMLGNVVINGNTVFGSALVEATGDYDAVMAKAPTQRLPME